MLLNQEWIQKLRGVEQEKPSDAGYANKREGRCNTYYQKKRYPYQTSSAFCLKNNGPSTNAMR